ncbi:MAG: DegT/DnrJ/EryC1/StrS family aminotransferase [Deltaproteobacteria bacterium]|nr:DegT/DnrJ/EryC1/StrS family aminotransferase [Deltaproteobacteria bacterium]
MTDRKVEFYRHDLGDVELESLKKTIGSVFLTTGPRTAEFERALGEYLGVPHVIGVSSCTDGLMLALSAFGVGQGDEVITTPMTFIATPNAAIYVGATPVFVDVDPATGLIDPDAVEAAITPRTKAILCVHLYGQMADVKRLRQIADRHHLVLIEDSAHGVEMRRDGAAPGQLGDAAVFSFYATKTITCGDGGAIAVRDSQINERLRRLRNHGMTKDAASRYTGTYKHWDMVELGFKCGLSDIDAAVLLPQLARVDQRCDSREAAVRRYEQRLADLAGTRLLRWTGRSAHHLFTVLTPPGRRDELLDALGKRGIGVAVNYRAVHLLTFYKERFGFRPGAFPHAEEIGDRTLTLPLYPWISLDDVDYVAEQYRSLAGGEAA